MIFDFLERTSIGLWNSIIDFSTLIMLIIYMVAFFVAQYYLIKFYIAIIKFITNIPLIKQYIEKFNKKLESSIIGSYIKKEDSPDINKD